MILIGQYDSSFVRRVGIALTLYEIPFEHRPWSVFGDADRISAFNPLTRVPTLVLHDGVVLVDSASMIDYLDSLAPAEMALFPRHEPARRAAMRVAVLATGLADKVVSLFYELRLHDNRSELWIERCRSQILRTLQVLEAEKAARETPFWFGDRIGHADIAVACAIRHLKDLHPDLVPMLAFPALKAFSELLEDMPVFRRISQPFVPPA